MGALRGPEVAHAGITAVAVREDVGFGCRPAGWPSHRMAGSSRRLTGISDLVTALGEAMVDGINAYRLACPPLGHP